MPSQGIKKTTKSKCLPKQSAKQLHYDTHEKAILDLGNGLPHENQPAHLSLRCLPSRAAHLWEQATKVLCGHFKVQVITNCGDMWSTHVQMALSQTCFQLPDVWRTANSFLGQAVPSQLQRNWQNRSCGMAWMTRKKP
jgi:hypothetical protein